jgi:hypothetical protein
MGLGTEKSMWAGPTHKEKNKNTCFLGVDTKTN